MRDNPYAAPTADLTLTPGRSWRERGGSLLLFAAAAFCALYTLLVGWFAATAWWQTPRDPGELQVVLALPIPALGTVCCLWLENHLRSKQLRRRRQEALPK